jgi:excisionase family DNA binding protein
MKLLTPKQVAQLYPLSVSLLYQLCDEKRIPHYRIGGRGKKGKILLAAEDIEIFLESQKVHVDEEDEGGLQHLR